MASPFASLVVSDPIPLPFDEGQWVKVRKLTGRQYEAAQESHRAGFIRGNRWADVFLQSLESGATAAAVSKALGDPLTGHDRYELVRAGLAAWSYDKDIPAYVSAQVHQRDVDADPAKRDVIDDLDDDAIELIAREVLKLTKPSLFAVEDADAMAEKKRG